VAIKDIQKLIRALSLKQKQTLADWLAKDIEQDRAEQESAPTAKKNRELVKSQNLGNIIYQLELIKCGKEGCKCNKGQLHGPYWYAYQRQGDKFKSSYIGKTLKLPEEKEI
jgi:hypothetical protein